MTKFDPETPIISDEIINAIDNLFNKRTIYEIMKKDNLPAMRNKLIFPDNNKLKLLEKDLIFLIKNSIVRKQFNNIKLSWKATKISTSPSRIHFIDTWEYNEKKIITNNIEKICNTLNVDAILIGFITQKYNKDHMSYSSRYTMQIINKDGEILSSWYGYGATAYLVKSKSTSLKNIKNTHAYNISITKQAAALAYINNMNKKKFKYTYFFSPSIKIEKDGSMSIMLPESINSNIKVNLSLFNKFSTINEFKKTWAYVRFGLAGEKAPRYNDLPWFNIGIIPFSNLRSNLDNNKFSYEVDGCQYPEYWITPDPNIFK